MNKVFRKWVMALFIIMSITIPMNRKDFTETISIQPAISFAQFMKPAIVDESVYEEITLTRFYPSDKDGSDTCMATMCTSKLQVNEKGWYTYQGKVVLGAATYACQARCKNRDKYGPLPEGFKIYNFYDEIKFILEGVEYTGIVLDSCGACMYHINGEKNQRYDIFTVNGSSSSSLIENKNIGKTSAKLVVESSTS